MRLKDARPDYNAKPIIKEWGHYCDKVMGKHLQFFGRLFKQDLTRS